MGYFPFIRHLLSSTHAFISVVSSLIIISLFDLFMGFLPVLVLRIYSGIFFKKIFIILLPTDLLNIFEVFLPQLLLYPNPSDPLNGDAASLMMKDRKQYDQKVRGKSKYIIHFLQVFLVRAESLRIRFIFLPSIAGKVSRDNKNFGNSSHSSPWRWTEWLNCGPCLFAHPARMSNVHCMF